jgi:predicted MFS family arabinose efflux permease
MRKWKVLAMYSLVAGLSQFLWLNFAPLISLMEKKYGISEDVAGLLLLVFPLTYVLMSVYAGRLIDRRGYRYGIGLGVVLMAAFSCLRIFDSSFWVLLAAQTGLSLGQPFVVNGITKLVMDWFDKKEEAIATGIGTAGMFIGMTAGLAATAPLVESIGLRATLAVFAVVAVAVCVGFFVVVHPNPDRLKVAGATPESFGGELRSLLREKDLLLMFTLSFLGLGFFNGLTTWLEPILAPHGIDAVKAGYVGGCLIIGGIFGAALIPALSDRFKRRKPFLIGSIAAALATIYPLCGSGDFKTLLGLSFLQGFFFLPAYSLMLEMCSELAGPARVGAATGLLMLTGNAGGVIVILAMQWVKSDQTGFAPAVHLMAALLVVGIVLALLVRETHPRYLKRPL